MCVCSVEVFDENRLFLGVFEERTNESRPTRNLQWCVGRITHLSRIAVELSLLSPQCRLHPFFKVH